MGEDKTSDYASASRSSAWLERAWQLFMALLVRRHDRADPACCAIETVERAMGVWEEYERRLCAKILPESPKPQAPPEPPPPSQPPPQPPFGFYGRWITRGGALVEVTPTHAVQGYSYTGGLPGEGFDLLWDDAGHSVSVGKRERKPEYDLMERAPSPGGHRMDYPPEDFKKEA